MSKQEYDDWATKRDSPEFRVISMLEQISQQIEESNKRLDKIYSACFMTALAAIVVATTLVLSSTHH